MDSQFNGEFSWEDIVNQTMPSPYNEEDMERVRHMFDAVMDGKIGDRLAQVTENEDCDLSIFMFTMCRDSIQHGKLVPMMHGDPNHPETVEAVKHPEDGTQIYGLSGLYLTHLLVNALAMGMQYMEIDNTLKSMWENESQEPNG